MHFFISLAHSGLVKYSCISELGHHWFRLWLVACSAPSLCLNQCWLIVNSLMADLWVWNMGCILLVQARPIFYIFADVSYAVFFMWCYVMKLLSLPDRGMSLSTKPLPEPIISKICDTLWVHYATTSWNMIQTMAYNLTYDYVNTD